MPQRQIRNAESKSFIFFYFPVCFKNHIIKKNSKPITIKCVCIMVVDKHSEDIFSPLVEFKYRNF